MGAFLSALFGGSNPTLSSGIQHFGDLGQFSSNLGMNDTNAASKYYNQLLSGSPEQISQALAPEISANQQQADQQRNTMAQFGNRSGGNTAASAALDSGSRANIINLIGSLMGGAAGNLGNLGTTNLGLGQQAYGEQANLSQQQLQNQQNSIFGQLFGGLAGATGKGIGTGLGGFLGGLF